MLIDKIKYILFLTTSSTYSDYNQIHQLGRIKCKLHDKKEGDTLYKPKKTTTKKTHLVHIEVHYGYIRRTAWAPSRRKVVESYEAKRGLKPFPRYFKSTIVRNNCFRLLAVCPGCSVPSNSSQEESASWVSGRLE